MAAKNELSDVDYVDDTRLFLVTLVGESSYALSTPRVWRDLDIALRKHKGALLRPIPDQSFLAFDRLWRLQLRNAIRWVHHIGSLTNGRKKPYLLSRLRVFAQKLCADRFDHVRFAPAPLFRYKR